MDELIKKAREASEKAYARYSKFNVGAAIRTSGNKIITGCNIENASYSLTICAERVAIFKAVSEGTSNFKEIVIYTPTNVPTPPCGACRQVLSELAPKIHIKCICDSDKTLEGHIEDFLPFPEIPLDI
jgi:cytidine deaminase